jgi:glutaredoxin-like protein NrdH
MVYNDTMAEGERKRDRKIRLYSLSTCPTCKRVKRFLQSNNIECEIIDVDTLDSGEQWLKSKELRQYNPKATYPTLIVEEVITDFDEQALKAALGTDGS